MQCITFHLNNLVHLRDYVFVNLRKVRKWVQFAGCSLDLMMYSKARLIRIFSKTG